MSLPDNLSSNTRLSWRAVELARRVLVNARNPDVADSLPFAVAGVVHLRLMQKPPFLSRTAVERMHAERLP